MPKTAGATLTWWGWGLPAHPPELDPVARRWLADATGWRPRPTPRVSAVALPPGVLPETARAALTAAVGTAHVSLDNDSRLLHAGGRSYLDLLNRRAGTADAPDAVVTPADHDEVAAVLAACVEHRVAVVPFGGGTSVVGGVQPVRGDFVAVVALDLARLDRLVDVDPESRTASLQAGLRTPRAEALLAEHGLTLGHTPQSAEFATIGGYAATRSSGQSSTGFGRFDDMVVGLRAVTPAGSLELGRAPRSAAGPDLRHLLLGSEGTLGVITEATLRVRRIPETRRYEAFSFRTFPDGLAAVRTLVQDGIAPDVVRLSDVDETRANLVLAGAGAAARLYLAGRGHGAGCIAILGWEGDQATVRARHQLATRTIRTQHGIRLGTKPGEAWRRERFAAPYLRDLLLDVGLLVETVETATAWSALPRLHAAIRAALAGSLSRPLIMSHVSHTYPAGASLYVTVLADRDDADPVGQWQRAKTAASQAIVDTGATITHHHGIGIDHRSWMRQEIGDPGLAALRAVKQTLDPTGILNPGKLLP
ncbi:MAG TPA: FAD-binding oxidoreductase [Mycobacteriales bacterium]|nr:FAD-binding oxidoreductase [Mycobacteriales bacterium]